ncbi:MAG: TMEM43 family protein [Myxococcota bacterium]|nr:TMEM43 family protein [Myxococcota bacterium]
MVDRVVRVEKAPGFFGKMKEAIKGVAAGLVMFLVAFPLVFWNECNSVEVAESLEEGAGLVVTIDSGTVDPNMDNKLVHASGEATTDEVLQDEALGLSVPGLRLRRSTEMYQWEEIKTERTEGDQKIITYDYGKKWSRSVINSSKFEEPAGHGNPTAIAVEDKTINAQQVSLGVFSLTEEQVRMIDNWSPLPADPAAALSAGLTVRGDKYYKASTGGAAVDQEERVGDLRISVEIVKPGPVTLVAQQIDSSFKPYLTSNGRSISLLSPGTRSAQEMFDAAQQANVLMTWLIRGVAFLFLFLGLRLLLGPVAVLGDKVPFVGSLITGALTLFCFLAATIFWFGAVALAWIVARPLIGILLLIIAVGALVGMIVLAKKLSGNEPEARPEPEAGPEPTAEPEAGPEPDTEPEPDTDLT